MKTKQIVKIDFLVLELPFYLGKKKFLYGKSINNSKLKLKEETVCLTELYNYSTICTIKKKYIWRCI